MKNSVLVIVDIQNDFCSAGALAVNGGETIVPEINRLIEISHNSIDQKFSKIVATADWHPEEHISFASFHRKEDYTRGIVNGFETTLWPEHCIAGSKGAMFYPELSIDSADLIIRKGTNPLIDSYSAFYENDRKTPTGLAGYLRDHSIKNVYLCGLAFDWCVYFSAIDASGLGFNTWVIKDLTKAVDLPEGFADEKENELIEMGINIISRKDI